MNSVQKLPTRKEIIAVEKQAGRHIAAVFPVHYPRPLLRAHGILPVEVWGPRGVDPVEGDTHLQPYTCSIVRHGLSFVMGKGAKPVDLFIVPHCCDTLQGLGSILLDFVPPGKPVFPLYIPRGKRAMDIAFLADELRALDRRLAQISGKPANVDELRSAIDVEDQANALSKKLYRSRRDLRLTCKEFYALLRSREYTPAEQYVSAARAVLEGRRADTASRTGSMTGIPVYLSGVVPEPPELFDALDDLDVFVAGDDFLSTGRRIYPANANPDPFERMAKSILEAPPDSTRGASFEERAEFLLDEVHTQRARGVIFYHTKFCEPEQFYLPSLQNVLEKNRIPYLSLEIDVGVPLSNQTITRLEAFVETIE